MGETKPKRFVPPTVDEVAAYCRERGNRVDPQRFVDFYTSKGWKVGKSSMQDWKASVRGWEKDAASNRGSPHSTKPLFNHTPITSETNPHVTI